METSQKHVKTYRSLYKWIFYLWPDGGVQQGGFSIQYEIIPNDPCLEAPCFNDAVCVQ